MRPWLAATFFCAPFSSPFLGLISCLGTVLSSLVMKLRTLQNFIQLSCFPWLHRKVYGAILLSARLVSSRVSYYPNSVSSFHQVRLVFSGNVQLNPSPTALSSNYTMNNSKLSCALLKCLSPCNKIVEFRGLVYGNNLDQLRNETSTIWNKFSAGLQDSFLEGIILSMSAFS